MVALSKALLGQSLFYLWTGALMILGLPLLAAPRRWLERAQTLWARGVVAILRHVEGVRSEFRGLGNIPAGAVLIAANHQSAWDTIIVHLILKSPAVVIKKELLRLPLYGWYCRKAGMIPIDRDAGGVALRKVLKQAAKRKAEGRPILIFPQGERVPVGESRPWQPGVAGLYTHLDLPVVPMAVNSGHFWPRRAFRKRPGTIVLEALAPIPPGLERGEFMNILTDRIGSATARLAAEAESAP